MTYSEADAAMTAAYKTFAGAQAAYRAGTPETFDADTETYLAARAQYEAACGEYDAAFEAEAAPAWAEGRD